MGNLLRGHFINLRLYNATFARRGSMRTVVQRWFSACIDVVCGCCHSTERRTPKVKYVTVFLKESLNVLLLSLVHSGVDHAFEFRKDGTFKGTWCWRWWYIHCNNRYSFCWKGVICVLESSTGQHLAGLADNYPEICRASRDENKGVGNSKFR